MIYIVPTPIGNLDDMTVRGIKVLSKAKIVLCEDGKITSKLLNLLKINNKPKYINLVKNNKFNESGIRLALSEIYGKQILEMVRAITVSPQNCEVAGENINSAEIIEKSEMGKLPLAKGLARSDWGYISEEYNSTKSLTIQNSTDLATDQNVIAIVTDAGTPGISDPAFEIIELLQELKLDYTILPGATACIPAIVTSNLVSKEFIFLGFLPLKKGRQTAWKQIAESKYPVVIYESCHRIIKLIEEMQINLQPQAKVSISQEISKKHENTWIGCVGELSCYNTQECGEFVIIIRN